MQLPAAANLRLAYGGGVLTVTLDRPGQRNALNRETVDELIAALDFAEQNESVRILLLRGSGGHFCAGGDVVELAQARAAGFDAGADPVADVSRAFGELCVRYAGASVATIALLEGTVMGGGFGLACVVDVALATPSAQFGLPETGLGLVPAQIAPFLVERLGYSEAKRLAVMGGRIGADEALRLGLVHELTESPDESLAAVTRRILACAPEAVATTKALLRAARLAPADELIDGAATAFAEALRGTEGMEGVEAFVTRRKPSWARH